LVTSLSLKSRPEYNRCCWATGIDSDKGFSIDVGLG